MRLTSHGPVNEELQGRGKRDRREKGEVIREKGRKKREYRILNKE